MDKIPKCGINLVFRQENCVYETVVPPLDERDFENTVTPIVQEYFEHGDTNEVAVSVPGNRQHVVMLNGSRNRHRKSS